MAAMPARRPTERSQLVSNELDVKNATTQVRVGFVRKVYGILCAQLLVTIIIAAPLSQARTFVKSNVWLLFLSIAMTTASACVMACCRDFCRKFPHNYIFLFTFTVFEGILLGFATAAFTWQSVMLAVGLTVAIFVGMTVYAWNTSTDFTGWGPYLFGFLCGLCAFGFALAIMSWCGVVIHWMYMLYDFLGVLLCTFFIIFDTQMILGQWGGHSNQFSIDDYVFASLNLYLDVVRLFLHLLRLFGERR